MAADNAWRDLRCLSSHLSDRSDRSDEVYIRDGGLDDIPSMSRVRVATWRTAYAGIISDEVLASLDPVRDAEQQARFFVEIPWSLFLIAAETGSPREMIGFAIGGRERSGQQPFQGELWGMYILKEFQNRGIGHRLIARVAERLAEQEMTSLIVWVLADNPYRRFYESLGGTLVGEQTIGVGENSLVELAYGWHDTACLMDPSDRSDQSDRT